MNLVDQTTDISGRVTYQILQIFDPPTWVKTASSADVRGVTDLPSSAYADPSTNMYPVHTAAATWMSTAFFLQNREQMNPKAAEFVEDGLQRASRIHDIGDSVELLKEAWANRYSTESLELADDDFAVVHTGADDIKERHYPLRNALEVKKAAEYLNEHRATFPYDMRRSMAERILEKAAYYGAGLGDDLDAYLQRQAGQGGCTNKQAALFIFGRAKLLRALGAPAAIQAEMGKMAQACLGRESKPLRGDQLVKLAGIVDRFDRDYEIEYSDATQPVEDALFALTHKSASDYINGHCRTTSGCVYKVDDFHQIKLSDVRDMLGEDIAEAVGDGGLLVSPEKLAEHAATLPRPDAELFDRLCKGIGVRPVMKEAAASQMSMADWFRLAKSRQLVS